MVVLLAAPPDETRQYCHNEVFRAECPSGHVVLVTSALYGRMSLGRCVKTDFGFIGCKVDVIDHVHRRCSGRRVCNVRVPDSTLDRAKPCNEDLKSYLEVAYSCAQGSRLSLVADAPAVIDVAFLSFDYISVVRKSRQSSFCYNFVKFWPI